MFREKIGQWQEAYMEILNQRYIALLSNEELPASERFWKLQQAIQVDRHRPGVCLELRKQTMVYDLAALIADCAITVEDLASHSLATTAWRVTLTLVARRAMRRRS